LFLKVEWIHDFPDQPILIYSELDEERYETRKVEIFRDGRVEYAPPEKETGSTFLSDQPLPPVEVIAMDPQFVPSVISAEEFEKVWEKATRMVG
jgi:hypothetical protein